MSQVTPLQTQKRKKVTIPSLTEKMKKNDAIVQMAVYDYRTAVVADRLGVDILCVSDTGGMVLFGHRSTVTVSFEEVMFMSQAVDRGSRYGLRMVDMPYWSFHVSPEQAVENAGRFVHEANAEVMKCEGNRHHARNIEAIVRAGIPVQGHIGITPMRMPQLGGFIAQGKTAERAMELIDDARSMVDAGCFSVMCEVTTQEVCQYLTETLPVPVISLGAGNKAHGVHIISSDLFHLYEEHVPRHSKIYTDLIPIIEDVITRYSSDVRDRSYPGPEHTAYMTPPELERFAKLANWTNPPMDEAIERERGKQAKAKAKAASD
jgi:3-methyl-2-oxobutanoate hydroxymethyltransferase